MKAKETTLVIDYKSALADFLDEKGIKWSSLPVGDYIKIYFEKPMNAEEIFAFAIDFRDYQDMCFYS